ncbi:MAG TPA: hypothetical protein PL058_00180 [Bacilli bacterium]|nr:hypothetical protein [Bacilli bacterium]HPK67291.1 hypothetical protein [Bacilli bacterium]
MLASEYIKKYQSVLYKVFSNALENNKLTHAYLLSGEPGTPLKDVALFLAKSLVCDMPEPLACERCLTCIRIEDGSFADIMIYDGAETTIKKNDVSEITSNFEKTALEAKGIMIYILHLVENMTTEAVNSLLKFLEEPGKNVFAFLTSENEAKVLPTIISRTQVLRLKTIDKQQLIEESVGQGCPRQDAEILSFFLNDPTTIINTYQSQEYIDAKNALEKQLEGLRRSREEAIFVSQSEIVPAIKSKETARFYLDMLTIVFQDLLNIRVNNRITLTSYDSILHELAARMGHLDETLIEIMTSRGKLDLNVNVALLLDHVIIAITKEK